MDMQEEVVGETMGMGMGSTIDQVPIMKGRRTKRQRPSSPFSLASSSSDSGHGRNDIGSSSSPVNSISFGTEEEEDMANCLILLARGSSSHRSGKSIEAIPTTSTGKDNGLCVYECKTCNRCFPSFQALGGHRASHKKPKATVNDEKKALVVYDGDEGVHQQQFNKVAMFSSHSNKSKVHECSICGSEFSSGQALGGHMRRHRTPTTASTLMAITHNIASVQQSHQEPSRARNLLALDLNLPAPEEDVCETKFSFSSIQQKQHQQQPPQQQQPPLIFSASPLVDCHY